MATKPKAAKKTAAKAVAKKEVKAIALVSPRELRLSLKGKTPAERTQLRREFAAKSKAARRARVSVEG